MSAKIVSLDSFRNRADRQTETTSYQTKIERMGKIELLEEMVRFQEERKEVGHLTDSLMNRGVILFQALEEAADSQELKILSRSYRRHLVYEIAAKTGANS